MVADEFNYKVEFVSVDLQDTLDEEEETEEEQIPQSAHRNRDGAC